MNICECLSVSAGLFPEKSAVIFRDRVLTYRELESLSRSAAEVLRSQNVRPGDRVAIQIGNNLSFPVWYYATLRAGGIAVSISTRLSTSERDFVIRDSGAKVLLADQPVTDQSDVEGEANGGLDVVIQVDEYGLLWNQVEIADTAPTVDWFDANPHQPALILYTSGTTGFPKGATLSHANVRSNVAAFNHLCKMQSTDHVLLAVPLFHCFGQNALLNSVLNVGGTLVLQQRFDLNEAKKLIVEHQVNQLYGVPMMFQLLLESCDPGELNSVDYCFSAAAPLSPQTSRQWNEKFGMPIHEGYGLTETSPFASYNHRNCYQEGSIGMPIDSVEMKIVEPETGQACQTGQVGEIAIRGPNVMLGYWNRPEETAAAIRDGWFLSGDLGKQDEKGYFQIVDRVKDMIAVGGLKVFPAEVERVMRDVPGVIDAAVVGVEEPVLGEQVIGFVVLDDSADTSLDAVQAHVKQDVASYKTPRRIFSIKELPRNPSGKVLKTQLRDLATEKLKQVAERTGSSPLDDEGVAVSEQASSSPAPNLEISPDQLEASGVSTQRLLSPGIKERLKTKHPAEQRDAIAEALCGLVDLLMNPPDDSAVQTSIQPNSGQALIDQDQTFLEIGMDSLMLVEMGIQLQMELETKESLPATLLFDYPRISDLADYMWQELSQADKSSEADSNSTEQSASDSATTESSSSDGLKQQIEMLSEEEALEQLLKELEQN